MLAVLSFLVFAALAAGLATKTFALDNKVEAWVGAGLVGVGAIVLTGWAAALTTEARLEWADRFGGDLLLAGLGIGLVIAGVPTFAAGVI